MGNYCHSGESKQDDDNASEKSTTPPILKNLSDHNYTENYDQSNSQDNVQTIKEAIYLEETLSTENVLDKSDLNALSGSSNSPKLEHLPPLPPALHLLYGNPNMISKIQKESKIVFYILSPTLGPSIEKDVFFKCFDYVNRKYQCSEADFEIHMYDLHDDHATTSKTLWKEKQPYIQGSEQHDQAANCLFAISKYINSCYLVPILMLNDSVGDILLPLSFETQDFVSLISKVEQQNPEDKLLVEKWYKLDKKSKPQCYRLQIKSNMIEKKESERVLHILTENLSVELLDLYLTTIVEQEINHTILFNQDVAKRCLWIQNTCETQNSSEIGKLESENLRRITNLRQELSMHLSDNQVFGSNFLTSVQQDQLELALQASLCNIVENIIDDYSSKVKVPNCTNGVDRRLLFELDSTDRFIKYLIQNRANFDILDDIKSFYQSSSKNIMIVEGLSGAGKTTLIAKIADVINLWKPNTIIITRFCKMSYYKCTPLMLLRSIVEQLSMLIMNKPYQKYENDLQSVLATLKEILSSTNKPICFLFDDFHITFKNKLEDVTWLNSMFTPHIKCIITLPVYEKPPTDVLTLKDFQSIDVQKLEVVQIKCPASQWKNIITHGIGDINTTIMNSDLLATWSTTEERILVKAKILWWLTWLGVGDLPEMSLKLLSFKVLNVIEEMFGEEITSYFISIIAASRCGLLESELIELFKEKYNEKSYSINSRFLWGKFSWAIGSLLSNGKNVYFVDSVLMDAIKEKYAQQIADAHKILLKYYTSQPDQYQHETFKRWNLQKFTELPYQSSIIDNENFNMSIYMTDLSWISSKLDCLGICSFFEDTLLCKSENSAHILFLCQIINQNFTSLTFDALQIHAHMQSSEEKLQNSQTIDPFIKKKWMSGLNIKSTYLKEKNIVDVENSESYSYDTAVSLSCPGNYVVMLSKTDQQLCVWDVERCKKVRVLKNVPQPQSISLVGEYCVAVLCNREIKLIDLDNGKHVLTLKGVMNQKMPYFAVHDPEHIVCLSRNRMYVNLMNLKSGDCITTFKAGEDRFLNSLLVSGDGRILVCGDETSKPFPLLVWNLTQRKLLYDLRIPHHDFVTALSGNCRGTLVGHTAPVTLLKIDTSGRILLSGDIECRDQSIRIWELHTGLHLATYTPKLNILACELSSDGNYVVLTFKGSSAVQTLELRGLDYLKKQNNSTFGNEDFEGTVFDLNC
ncbi:uncharacterized protein LOC134829264 isoform X2 [Culicoides brevitarsis]|uniref:uncharacterized protein LOC134829264 isoform X2 n=1 Tax=Culicoides brevitarsis TaxID=469753 RepID=UPI00307B3CA3